MILTDALHNTILRSESPDKVLWRTRSPSRRLNSSRRNAILMIIVCILFVIILSTIYGCNWVGGLPNSGFAIRYRFRAAAEPNELSQETLGQIRNRTLGVSSFLHQILLSLFPRYHSTLASFSITAAESFPLTVCPLVRKSLCT